MCIFFDPVFHARFYLQKKNFALDIDSNIARPPFLGSPVLSLCVVGYRKLGRTWTEVDQT